MPGYWGSHLGITSGLKLERVWTGRVAGEAGARPACAKIDASRGAVRWIGGVVDLVQADRDATSQWLDEPLGKITSPSTASSPWCHLGRPLGAAGRAVPSAATPGAVATKTACSRRSYPDPLGGGPLPVAVAAASATSPTWPGVTSPAQRLRQLTSIRNTLQVVARVNRATVRVAGDERRASSSRIDTGKTGVRWLSERGFPTYNFTM